MNTHQFVEAAYAKYLANGVVIGDPAFGKWEAAHHPQPKCLGGTQTVLLLKSDHAIHNLLQSEELNHPCVYGWERDFVPHDFSELAEKWITIQRSNAGKSGDPSKKAVGGAKVGELNRQKKTNNLSKDVLSRAASSTNSQVWKSTVDGFCSNAGAVACYNKARGWDPNARVRVS